MNYKLLNKSVFLLLAKILVIADVHIGYEDALMQAGIMMPRSQFKETMNDLKKVFDGIKAEEIIILGDLKHEFGTISGQEWREVREFLKYLKEKARVILIKGNHDKILEPISQQENIEVKDFYIKDEVAFIHGDKKFKEVEDKEIKLIMMGHFHPAITIQEGAKKETYKCFLVGNWKGKEIIILPSFFPLVEGYDVTIEDTNLAYDFNLKNFQVFIPVENSVLEFGKVRDVGRLN